MIVLLCVFSSCNKQQININHVFNRSQVMIYSLYDCIFCDLFGSIMNGGGIGISSNHQIELDIHYSVFVNCSVATGYNGGGLSFYVPNGGTCSLEAVCASGCISQAYTNGENGQGQFACIHVGQACNLKLDYVSVTQCCPSLVAKRWRSSVLINGFQSVSNSNYSKNNVEWQSAYTSRDFQSVLSIYTTITNNTSSSYSTLVYYSGTNITISNMNFINNIQKGADHGLIRVGYDSPSHAVFKMCIFMKNTISSSGLFCLFLGSITIDSCYIDSYTYKSSSPTVLSLLSITETFSNVHHRTFWCYAELPLSKPHSAFSVSLPILTSVFLHPHFL